MIKTKLMLICSIGFYLVACTSVPPYYAESDWQLWKQQYDKDLTGYGGWLSLAGLYWLEPGSNTLGSGTGNTHQFPSHAPKQVGTILVNQKQVVFDSQLDKISINHKPIKSGVLSVKDATPVNFDAFEFFVIEREGNLAIRLIDNNSPAANTFKGSKFYTFDNQAIIKGKLVPHQKPTIINVATVYGTNRKEKSAGMVHFEYKGSKGSLEVVDYGETSPLYLFFSDLTNGETTYDAGRYLKFKRADKNGNVILDFNRAYNPPCAFTEYATCPLTPPQNRLNFAIKAGELNYKKEN